MVEVCNTMAPDESVGFKEEVVKVQIAASVQIKSSFFMMWLSGFSVTFKSGFDAEQNR